MHVLALRPTERRYLAALRRWHPTAPDEVISQEARHRLGARVLGAVEAGQTQPAIARGLGYSVSQIERILAVARRNRDIGVVSPLAAWRATEAAHEPAPAPEAAIPDEVDVITIGIDSQPPMAASAVAWTGTDRSRSWILRLDGNGLSLSGVPPTPEPIVPTDADRALYATIADRGPLLGAAVRLLQIAAGIPATGDVDDETMSIVAGLAAWQSRPRPLMDAVERFVDGRRASDRLTEGTLAA